MLPPLTACRGRSKRNVVGIRMGYAKYVVTVDAVIKRIHVSDVADGITKKWSAKEKKQWVLIFERQMIKQSFV